MTVEVPEAIKTYLEGFSVNFSKNKLRKRTGEAEKFDIFKVFNAVSKSFEGEECVYTYANVTYKVFHDLLHLPKYKPTMIFELEDVQDIIRNILMREYPTIAEKFIVYREMKRKSREAKDMFDIAKIINSYIDESDWRTKENSNVGYSIGALILNNSGAMSANYWLNNVYPKEVSNAHRQGALHIHDASMLTGYCMGLSLRKLVMEGIPGLNGNLASKPAKHLTTICNQIVNMLGIHQNEVAGAVAFSSVDTWLAPFVRYDKMDLPQVKQCIQSLVFGLNTPSRWGCVLPSTEVLTPQGWKNMNTLKEGDDIYCWDRGNLVIGKNNKTVIKDYSGQLCSIENSHYSYRQLVTEDHRCLRTGYSSTIKESEGQIILAKDVKKYDRLPISITAEIPDNPEISDVEIEVATRIYCDGSFQFRELQQGKTLHKVTYFKSEKRENTDAITELFRLFGIESEITSKHSFGKGDCVKKWTFYSDDARKLLELVGGKYEIHEKFMTLGSRQSKLFLDTWMLSDGIEEKAILQYDSDQIGKALQHIAVRAGYTSYRHTKKVRPSELNNFEGGLVQYIKLRRMKTVCYKNKKSLFYSGKVWCPSTTYGTAIFRDEDSNVFISGQSQSPFTNFTFDIHPPKDLVNTPAIIGGEPWETYTYADFQSEMDLINIAFLELMYEGDANGRPFSYPIPTYNITKDFAWESQVVTLLFKVAGKYGLPYFQNFISSSLDPSAVRSMCCRLQIQKDQLEKRGGGLFGANEFTGSMGVCTINLPQIGYLVKKEIEGLEKPLDEIQELFWVRVKSQMDLARQSLVLKKTKIEQFTEIGLYPYTQHHIRHWNNHFLTIGLVGMNEALINLTGKDISDKESREIGLEILKRMRAQIIQYQLDDEKDGKNNLYNLEATPAEGCGTRLAQLDRTNYPDIITAGNMETGDVYYTNSTMLPVDATDDLFDMLDHQDEFQTQYTGGTVQHLFLGEQVDSEIAKSIIRKTFENYKLPYVSLTPTYSVCKQHGYLTGKQPICPKCGEETEVYSRIVGYYRPTKGWNKGKAQEFKERKTFNVPEGINE